MSQRAVIVVGFSELSWLDFQSAMNWLDHYLAPIPSVSAVFNFDYVNEVIHPVLSASRTDRFSVVGFIQMTKSAFCSDPRDRVYGILNMHAINLGISPDYSKTKEEVYEDLTRAYLRKFWGLEILTQCELGHSAAALPSWVLNYRSPNKPRKSLTSTVLVSVG